MRQGWNGTIPVVSHFLVCVCMCVRVGDHQTCRNGKSELVHPCVSSVTPSAD